MGCLIVPSLVRSGKLSYTSIPVSTLMGDRLECGHTYLPQHYCRHTYNPSKFFITVLIVFLLR